MKLKSILAAVLVAAFFFTACTENQKAKNYGGTATIQLEPNTKLINAIWKKDDLWYLTRPMLAHEKADTLYFKEQSSYGVWEGTYIIYETKTK